MSQQSPLPNETEADTRAVRIDPALAANGWEGPAKIDGARISREEMLWPGRILSGGTQNAPKPVPRFLSTKRATDHDFPNQGRAL